MIAGNRGGGPAAPLETLSIAPIFGSESRAERTEQQPRGQNRSVSTYMAESAPGGADIAVASGFGLDSEQFREAMSRVAASVHIVTTNGPAGLGGITVSTATSITLDPAMMLFCIQHASTSAQRMVENGVFCINALSPAHRELAEVFAGQAGQGVEERFARGKWTKLSTGSPVLQEAAASFDCRLIEAKRVGTHLVMIGRVETVALGPEDRALAYVRRQYKSL